MKYCIRIEYTNQMPAYLQHKNRMEWSKRQAQRHKADILAGRTGIHGFVNVTIEEV